MTLPLTLVVGVLMLSGVQASDIADGSKSHVFLSKYMPLRSEYSKSSIGDNGKFMAHHLKHMEHEGRPEASSDQNDLAEDNSFTVRFGALVGVPEELILLCKNCLGNSEYYFVLILNTF